MYISFENRAQKHQLFVFIPNHVIYGHNIIYDIIYHNSVVRSSAYCCIVVYRNIIAKSVLLDSDYNQQS